MADWAPPESDFQDSATPSWSPPESDFAPPETAARVAGLGARAVATGAAAIPNTLMTIATPIKSGIAAAQPLAHALRQELGWDPPDPPSATATSAAPEKPSLMDFVHPEKWQQAAEYFANQAGLPTPATPTERIGYSAAQALPSAALAPEAPVMGAISSAVGSGTSQAIKEGGGGPVAQTLGGLLAGSVPALASGVAQGARGVIRDPDEIAQRMADAEASETPLTAGQATGSRTLQMLEGASGKIWGGGAIKAAAENQSDILKGRIGGIVDNLAGGGDVSPTGAGEAINAGAKTAVANMRAAESAAYDKVDSLVPPATPISVQNTLSKLDELAAPTPGAEATSQGLIPSKIAQMRENLAADAARNGGQLPYDAVKQLRSAVGAMPFDPSTNGAFKQVYKALSGDMESGASAVSPEAQSAAADAASLYKANSARREFLDGVVDKAGGPEAVYQAATNGTKQGATKIGGVMSALDPGQQNLVRATVLDRLGRAVPSAQNAADTSFDPSTFLTNWAKLDPAAKDALFGASGQPKTLRAGLDSLSNTMSTIRSSTLFKNPSGTAGAVGHGLGLAAVLEGTYHAALGQPAGLAGTAAAVGGNMILSRALTNPKTVAWLAQTAKLPTYALPNAVNQLAKINDPDAADLATMLRSKPQ